MEAFLVTAFLTTSFFLVSALSSVLLSFTAFITFFFRFTETFSSLSLLFEALISSSSIETGEFVLAYSSPFDIACEI